MALVIDKSYSIYTFLKPPQKDRWIWLNKAQIKIQLDLCCSKTNGAYRDILLYFLSTDKSARSRTVTHFGTDTAAIANVSKWRMWLMPIQRKSAYYCPTVCCCLLLLALV